MKQLLSLIAALTWIPVGTAAAPSAEEARFFETRIRPLLAEHCFSCHGPKKQKSSLRLDSADALKQGGDSEEPIVVAGHPDKSLLIRAVRHEGKLKMPPENKLPDRAIADLTRWVQMGAPYPQPAQVSPGSEKHWAFQPPADPAVPVLNAQHLLPGTPIDAFIFAKLEAKGLRPQPPADRRTLIRRAAFDLTGLPPTPAEVEAFVNDQSIDAYAKLIDCLLASPAYGEKWGRHWLDVARYADSNGLDENVCHGNAWRYRDYVVAAFNADKPYDRFLMEQIAGDLLPAESPALRHEQLIATGFLSLGPKVLAEPDEKKMEMDIVDEQIDTLGRAVLGLTIGCARCHDHKFDPLPTEDYYALAGIFRSTKTMENFKKVARWHENPIGTEAETAAVAAYDKEVSRIKSAIERATTKKDEPAKPDVQKLREELARLEKNAPEATTAMGVTEGTVVDTPVLKRGNYLTPGKIVSRHFPVMLAGENQQPLPAKQSGRLELARWLTAKNNPLTARVMVNRIWRWHFGQGIVRSVDNFGRLGEKPDHPELLDWLAHRFMESGWSVKAMHRLIMLSATYQQASGVPTAEDPDNRLLARMSIRRLEAEEIRDSLLAVSGELERTSGGPAITNVKNRGYLFDHTSKDITTYNSKRRSLYLPFIRNNLYDMFQLFDAVDPAVSSGDRTTTTVATQALFWMNSPLVVESSQKLAQRLLLGDGDDAQRLRSLYLTAYGRAPTAREMERSQAAVAGFEQELLAREPVTEKRRLRAWGLLCQVVLAGNEFVYVR